MRGVPGSFRARVAMALSGVVLALGVAALLYARQDMGRILGLELEARGQAIALDLATGSVDPLLTRDLVGLHDLLERARANNRDIRYALVVDASGRVRASTFGEGVPRGLLEANQPGAGGAASMRRFATEEGLVRDFAVPIFGGEGGVARVGMSSDGVESAVATYSGGLAAMVSIAMALGLLASYLLSCYLTAPLGRLIRAVQSIARGDLGQRVALAPGGEVGELGRAFNTMADELERKESQRRALLEKVISSQEEERRRVARDLHDEVAQHLALVLLRLEQVERPGQGPEDLRSTVAHARSVAEQSLREIRRIIQDLRPTVLDDLGLVPAIRSCAQGLLGPLDTELVLSADDVRGPLEPLVETAVFRIVQEALSNVARHSGATRATVTLALGDGALRGSVADDGRGFPREGPAGGAGPPGPGLGLQGMEERATLLGGTLEVSSRVGRGTTVAFSIPLSKGACLMNSATRRNMAILTSDTASSTRRRGRHSHNLVTPLRFLTLWDRLKGGRHGAV